MFEINLLKTPGLQVTAPKIAPPKRIEYEDELVNRLEVRGGTSAAITDVMPKYSILRSLIRWLIALLLAGLAGYWAYQAWTAFYGADGSIISVTQPVTEQPAAAAPALIGSPASILPTFIEHLPSQATIDFMDVGAGVLIYRMWGRELSLFLPQLNAMVDGHIRDDLLAPDGGNIPGYWLGTVIYESEDQEGVIRPVDGDYGAFFDTLKTRVNSTGGLLVEVIPGAVSAGEYVISGTLRDLHSHLLMVSRSQTKAYYHRMSIIRQYDQPAESYLLRVLFHLVKEPKPSPLLSLRGN
ncbi:MAG: hypothetical protein KAU50_04745 [Candidatus Marinimicrobia bacterium]|nr:hypothetical protein [Candidatus Neomarinimicrobiota bacterium]